jgi:hypothetical protein
MNCLTRKQQSKNKFIYIDDSTTATTAGTKDDTNNNKMASQKG